MSRYARSEMILEENWEIFNPIASQRQVVVHLKLCAVVVLHALCNREIPQRKREVIYFNYHSFSVEQIVPLWIAESDSSRISDNL